MMSVENTAHEFISNVNKPELYKVLKNRYGHDIHGTCFEPTEMLLKTLL